MVTSQFEHLFTPFQMRHLTLPNRIVSTAHATALAENGAPGPRLISYLEEKARGGCGLVMAFGSASIHPTSPAADWGGVELFDDRVIPHLRRTSDAIHRHGAGAISQICHRGRRGTTELYWRPLLAPSPIPERTHRETPHEMEKEDIDEIVEAYGQAALRVKKGGFDGVEILLGGGHLPWQFLSPFSNKRTDEYGGSLENRMRFAIEVLDCVRGFVGDDFVIGAKLTADEKTEGGLDQQAATEIIKRLAARCEIDYLSINAGTAESLMGQTSVIPSMWYRTGLWVPYADAVRREVDVPVLTVGRIIDPLQAEWILAEGKADLVAMTRALIADPHLPNKAREGKLGDIRPCIGSNQGCAGRLYHGKNVTCLHNPVISREQELAETKPAAVQKKVVVVGGGPSGLEAARAAAERGHNVVLFEKKTALGGQITAYAQAKGRGDFGAIPLWLEGQARKLGVEIRLGTEATVDLVLSAVPDAVIVAAGSSPLPLEVPGADTGSVVFTEDILTRQVDWGNKVLIIDQDAHNQGPAVADHLAKQGRTVEIVSDLFSIGEDIDISTKPLVYKDLYASGVTLSPYTAVKEIHEEQVVLKNVYSDEERVVDGVSTIVYAGLRKAEDSLYHQLKGKISQLFLVGDAMAPRKIHDAMLEGTRAGRAV